MGIFNRGSSADQAKSTADLQHEAKQAEWAAQSKDPHRRADAHGRLDEIDEVLEDRGF